MKAEAQSFAQIVSEPKYIVVPFFQREYVWDKDNWEDLLDEFSMSESNHFLGSMIFKHEPTSRGENCWSVVDGQQRLTTLSILFSVCCKLLMDSATTDMERKFFENRRDQLLFVFTPNGLNIKIRHSRADREAYARVIVQGTDNSCHSDERSEKKIVRCRDYFLLELSNKPEKTRKIFDLLNSIDTKMLVNIQLEDNDNEQAIFDTINSAGIRLTAADTIKNSLFQKMIETIGLENHAEVERMHDEFWESVFYGANKDYWSKIISQGRINRITLEIMLHCVAIIEGFYDPNKHSVGELADCYKEYVKDKTYPQLSEFVKKIAKYAEVYHQFFWDEGEYNDSHETRYKYKYDNVCKRTLHILRFCDTTTFDPLILKLVMENPIGDGGTVSDTLRNSLDGIAKYVLRHVVCHASTKNFNKECAQIINGERTIESYIAEKVGSSDAKSRIADDEVRLGLRNIKNRTAKGILFWLELKRRSQHPYDIQELSDEMELEHLMPQKWAEYWPITSPAVRNPEDGAKILDPVVAEAGRRCAIYEIGNMALLNKKLNIIIRNHSIQEKMQGQGPQCPGIAELAGMRYTKDVVDKVENNGFVWDEKMIRDRTNILTNDFLSLWGVEDVLQTAPAHSNQEEGNETPMQQAIDSANSQTQESLVANGSLPTQDSTEEIKIGKIAKTVFPILFAENKISDSDMTFLLSDEARIQFKTNGFNILKETTGDINEDAKDSHGRKRFYTDVVLEHGDKHYLLTREWYKKGKGALLSWFSTHGITPARIVELAASVQPETSGSVLKSNDDEDDEEEYIIMMRELIADLNAGKIRSKLDEGRFVMEEERYDKVESGKVNREWVLLTRGQLKRTIGIKTVRLYRFDGSLKPKTYMRFEVDSVCLEDINGNECDAVNVPDGFNPETIVIHLGKRIL